MPSTHVRTLKETTDGKPLWLWGGGELFGVLSRAGLVDGVEVAVIPVVLGAGIPLMARRAAPVAGASPAPGGTLSTGTMFLEYDVHA